MEWYSPPSNIQQLIRIVNAHYNSGCPFDRGNTAHCKNLTWLIEIWNLKVVTATYYDWLKWKDPDWTHSISKYEAGLSYQSAKQYECTILFNATSDILTNASVYLTPQFLTDITDTITLLLGSMPIYVLGTGPNGSITQITVKREVFDYRGNGPRVSYSWGGRRKGDMMDYYKWIDVTIGYDWKRNEDFDSAIQSYKNKNSVMLQEINLNLYNNCNNPNALLDNIGLQSCGINDELNTFHQNIQSIKNQSNYVMSKIQNTAGFPQYAQAKQIDDIINNYYNWYPLNERSTYNPNYAKLTKAGISNYITAMTTHVQTLYGNCVIPTIHIGLNSDDVPNCVSGDYAKAAQKCGQAISKSNGIGGGYGLEKLTDLWTDVSNSIPGNMKTQSSLILNTSTNSCKKWVEMFNMWEEAELKALSEPCIPERPIESNNDPVLIKKANDWSIAASNRIKQLMIRLKKIQNYTQNYPNILQLKKDDVTLAPYSLPVTAIIKKDYNNSKNGEAPMQSLEMIVPNGKPGKPGSRGIMGLTGRQGGVGNDGPIGPVGNYNVPRFTPLNN